MTGTLLFGTGLLMAAGGFDVYRRWKLRPPDGWPMSSPDAVPLSAADRTRWTDESWWWPVVIAVLAVLVLLALRWLLAQLRRTHSGPVPLGGPHGTDGVELREQALSDALAADVRRQPGVQHARVRMTGRPDRPTAHIDLTLTPDSEPGPVLRALCDGPVERARRSTGQAGLSARVRLKVTPHKAHRAQ
ncbi:alkaline shock response membrane anchor protein AmaP [Streptomyces sp. NPDC088762]|uniref:alkaline shock response membrane anchor protein AmaP n=1 Tax=Streptomyces sp. NPDC088762 TaxID=3365891 RepID=UPI00380E0100